MTTAIPELQTARLTLRGHAVDDLDEYAAMWADPAVVRYIGGRPSSRQESWARLLRQVGHWRLLGFGYWILRDRSTGRLVGEVGLASLERDLEPSLAGTAEAGWVLASWAHGAGFATEAVTRALEWNDQVLRLPVTSIIDPGNAASIRVAHRCGFTEAHRTTYLGDPTIVFARPAASHSTGR
jgi:RimJ/RimL family protein N-acetyltransferase